jgi:hypothetical protein
MNSRQLERIFSREKRSCSGNFENGTSERDEIERQIARIDTALDLFEALDNRTDRKEG